jgi:dipeptidase
MNSQSNLYLFIYFILFIHNVVNSCTTFGVGKKATVDGSVMATHTNDGGGTTDARLVKVPARDFEEGSLRPIMASPENYPRYVGTERKVKEYELENCQAGDDRCYNFVPMGFIPQVSHTFAYFEQTYGAMNEKQVGIAESTCSGVYVGVSVEAGGKALLSVDQLSQIAMERSSTARQAVEIMGELSEKFGFYGESTSFEGGSESLIVTDPEEAWVFHILADPTQTSSIWVAARIPDDSVAVVANMFTIRDVDLSDTVNYLGRQDMWEIAEEQGLWKQGEEKDFTRTFSDGEYAHKYYSGRRMWGTFRILAPEYTSENLHPTYNNLKENKPYPFAVPVKTLLTLDDMKVVLRDWYNGTEYSTGDGISSGPFNTPDRFSGGTGEQEVNGDWERTIALYRSSDTYIVQSRSWLPDTVGGIIWFGPHTTTATSYVPIMAGMLISPECLSIIYQGVMNMSSSFWAHRLVANTMQIKYSYMIVDVRNVQKDMEGKSQDLVNLISKKYSSNSTLLSNNDLNEITNLLTNNAKDNQKSFIDLFYALFFKYSDGYINSWSNSGTNNKVINSSPLVNNKDNSRKFTCQSVGYPAWWLETVGYQNGPPPVNSK